MKFIKTKISDVILIKPKVFEDNRGYFMELYHEVKFKESGIDSVFVQDNHAKSFNNTLRGLHFQINYPQAKLLRCLKGKIFDVAVDLRKESPDFGKWVGLELSEKNKYQLFIPKGFAHGYYVMSEIAEVSYKCSEIYYQKYEKSIKWNDPDININWPSEKPVLSDKDLNAGTFQEYKNQFNIK